MKKKYSLILSMLLAVEVMAVSDIEKLAKNGWIVVENSQFVSTKKAVDKAIVSAKIEYKNSSDLGCQSIKKNCKSSR